MTTEGNASSPAKAELDLWDVLVRIRRRWLVILSGAVVGLAAAVYFLHISVFSYTASMKVIPASTTNSATSQPLGNTLGALASLAGINAQTQTVLPFTLYLQGLSSFEVATKLMTRDDLVHRIFASQWNAETQQWQEPPPSTRRQVRDFLAPYLGIPMLAWQPPRAADLQEYLTSALVITQDPTSPVVLVTYSHPDPVFAVEVLKAVNYETDQMVRERALARATSYIGYLSKQLQTVNIAEHRLTLTQALSEQEKFRMAASADISYAADAFDGPIASLVPTWPRPLYVLAIGFLGGIALSIPVILLLGDRPSTAARATRAPSAAAVTTLGQVPRQTPKMFEKEPGNAAQM